jgi:hypothetical protein
MEMRRIDSDRADGRYYLPADGTSKYTSKPLKWFQRVLILPEADRSII